MPLNWIDMTFVPVEVLFLLERIHISWFQRWRFPEETRAAFGWVLKNRPDLAWYLSHKDPSARDWIQKLIQSAPQAYPDMRQAELLVLRSLEDLIVYIWDPSVYDQQPFVNWNSEELTGLADFEGKLVLDIGAGTGKQSFSALNAGAANVIAVEPVENLRIYMRQKAKQMGIKQFYTVDGSITAIPFPDQFADITMGGHVFGDDPEDEIKEMIRVTKPDGFVILCPGNNDEDNERHDFLLSENFSWGRFEEPQDGWKRKYWKQVRG